uniref:Uncharacterized protein n=1 Tax=Arundo donax TaxID=35708 RepID=A0A0A9DNW7_ARUDO
MCCSGCPGMQQRTWISLHGIGSSWRSQRTQNQCGGCLIIGRGWCPNKMGILT